MVHDVLLMFFWSGVIIGFGTYLKDTFFKR